MILASAIWVIPANLNFCSMWEPNRYGYVDATDSKWSHLQEPLPSSEQDFNQILMQCAKSTQ